MAKKLELSRDIETKLNLSTNTWYIHSRVGEHESTSRAEMEGGKESWRKATRDPALRSMYSTCLVISVALGSSRNIEDLRGQPPIRQPPMLI